MIGGTVIEVVQLPDRIWINCEENNSSSQCAIYVERTPISEQIKRADWIWWQGRWAMWTPYEYTKNPHEYNHGGPGLAGDDYDVKIPRIGFSGVSRPPRQSEGGQK